jgi:hypothetical protein
MVAAGDHDARTRVDQAARHAESDPAVAAGDDRNLAGQVEYRRRRYHGL